MAWRTTHTLRHVTNTDSITIIEGLGGAPTAAIPTAYGIAYRLDSTAGAIQYETPDYGVTWTVAGTGSTAIADTATFYGTDTISGATDELAAALGGTSSTVRAYTTNYCVTDNQSFLASVEALDTRLARDVGTKTIADPGTGAAIPVTHSVNIALTIAAGAETNTLAAPTYRGQTMAIIADTAGGGSRAITSAVSINQATNTIMTFGALRDFIKLEGVYASGTLKWQVVANDGVALS
jgi:hypothetical protein